MQLVAYGAQDIYLTGNPQITFFKVVYRRHTNFSMETIKQTVNGSQGDGGNGTVTISRNGDLVNKVYVSSTSAGITDGSKMVASAELEIGGQRIDKHTTEWNNVWNELTTPESKAIGLKSLQSCIGTSVNAAGVGALGSVKQVQVPLNFWFCRNPGLALPLIALQYHEVKIKFVWGAQSAGEVGASFSCDVLADYIYLDTDERRRFAQVSHEYLIEQLQIHDGKTTSADISEKLNFNHPVKELIWTCDQRLDSVILKLNGHDRFSSQDDEYFTLRQPFDYHTAVPKQNLPTTAQLTTLDRQTQFVAPQNHPATPLGDAAAGAPSSLFISATGAASVIGFAAAPTPGEFAVGQQLAITCTASGATPTVNGTIGRVYFTTVTTAGTVAGNQVTLGLTIPTTADAAPLTLVTTAASGTFVVNLVTNGNSKQARTSKEINRIGVYSFALKPEEHQPSGTCNFSRIDNAILKATASGTPGTFKIYAVNYNVLRIMSGMGGLAYSN